MQVKPQPIRILGVIPARFASTRFPGKPLALIQGIPMIVRVLQQANQCQQLTEVMVATDDERILSTVKDAGGKAILTRADHPSGTDRVIEVMEQFPDYDLYINIQGDEPFLNPEDIDKLIAPFILDNLFDIGTLVCRIYSAEKLTSPSVVKVVKNNENAALYFSRHPIPYLRSENDPNKWLTHFNYLQHIGVYLFKKQVLQKIKSIPVSALEKAESLEQLRWLEAGFKILTVEVEKVGLAIDTEEDWRKANEGLLE
jgi:3-deoxy-manno-octulosonate cytidylyltransferase (CMP-KDO synthetase)